jgi:hypothetical protein
MSTANFANRVAGEAEDDDKISCSFLIENNISISSSRQDNSDVANIQ